MDSRERGYLLKENKKLQETLEKISLQNTELLMLIDFLSTLLVATDIEKITQIIIRHIRKITGCKVVKFVRKELKPNTYGYYTMRDNDIGKVFLDRSQLGKDCFFMYCKKLYISNEDEPFIAVPIKYEGENIGAIIIEEFESKKLENQNVKLIEIYSLISGIIIKNCILTVQFQMEKKVILEQNRKMNEDLQYAQRIQEYLLPSGENHFRDYYFCCNHIQAQYLGGDFYDVFEFSDNKIIFYIADVSGNGVSSALFTLFLKQAVRGIATSFNGLPIYPSKILEKLHIRFNDFMIEEELYIGILMGVLDTEKNRVTICNGGHNVEPIHVKVSEKKVISYQLEGLPINNWFKDPKFPYEDKSISLNKKDRLVLLTDGATEVRGKENKTLGLKEIKEILYENMNLECDVQFEKLLKHINTFTNESAITDDIAFLCLKRKV
ncbi:PP2C family protein-serine/threonine phosphatase [Wukongibacter sp. M2B1]|uniref:PP2C family protein-serine/threonine phosphatase n=1 Tax=Wukongibacter sp. M2B1 TaxID=3088895 RepID=UPI003D796974